MQGLKSDKALLLKLSIVDTSLLEASLSGQNILDPLSNLLGNDKIT